MKSTRLLLIGILKISVIYGCNESDVSNLTTDLNPKFETQLAKALDLSYVNTDTLYNSSYTRIFNDTIVGTNRIRNGQLGNPKFYFIQSLKNLKYKKLVDYNKFIPSYIDAYRNGCLYFGVFGGSFVIKLCSDKSLTQLLTEYSDTLFYANKVMLYQNKFIVTSMNGIFVFDSQGKLVLKHKYLQDVLATGASRIVDNKLVFTEVDQVWNPRDSTYKATSWVHCVDLDLTKLIWSRQFENTYTSSSGNPNNGERFSLIDNGHSEIVFPTHDSNYLLNLKDGSTIWDSKRAIKGLNFYALKFDGDLCYGSDTKSIFCINTKTNKILWKLNSAQPVGTLDPKIIGRTLDNKHLLIINKSNGAVLRKILAPHPNSISVVLIDKYVLINDTVLYKSKSPI